MKVDSLVKLASSGDAQLMGIVSVEVLSAPSIDHIDVNWILEVEPKKESCMNPIKEYLLKRTHPDGRTERRKLPR